MAQRNAQSNALLYSLITFVGLFVVAVVLAIVFYVKSEEYYTQLQARQADMDKIATNREVSAIARLAGRAQQGKSHLGTLLAMIDQLISAITGQVPAEENPADVKVNDALMRINQTLSNLPDTVQPTVGAQGVSLLGIIDQLKTQLAAERQRQADLAAAFDKLKNDYDLAQQNLAARQEVFLAELKKSQQLTDEIRTRFDQLKTQLETATSEQIQTYRSQLEAEQARLNEQRQHLQQIENQLKQTEKLLQDAVSRLEAIKPQPDVKVAAYKPDARIVLLDFQNGLVTLDVGKQDGVYQGLTFAIYQSNLPIPEDGVGKAEIEVFQVGDKVSVARIVRSDKRNPIATTDWVINLIWDPRTSNKFVVIGDFDVHQTGKPSPQGAQAVKDLIQRWGGRLMDEVSIDTDFVIVGAEPAVPPRPTQAELDADPTAQRRYDLARQALDDYNRMLARAAQLRVPVFNYKQFIALIGGQTLENQLLP